MIYLTQGILFGFYASVMPGPFQAFILSQIVRDGWKKALPLALIPLVTDGPIMLAFVFLLSMFPVWLISLLRIAGGLYILFLAWDAFKSSIGTVGILSARTDEESSPSAIVKGLLLNFLNPNVYIFWATIGVPTILDGWQKSPLHGISFGLGFYLTMVPVTMGWIYLLGTIGNLNPKIRARIGKFIVLMLIFFGMMMIYSGISDWINSSPIMKPVFLLSRSFF